MKSQWLNVLASVTVVVALTCLGCGQSTTTVSPDQAPSQENIQAEMEANEGELMGDQDPSAGAKPAEEKPAEETEE